MCAPGSIQKQGAPKYQGFLLQKGLRALALLGWLYLDGRHERLQELLAIIESGEAFGQ